MVKKNNSAQRKEIVIDEKTSFIIKESVRTIKANISVALPKKADGQSEEDIFYLRTSRHGKDHRFGKRSPQHGEGRESAPDRRGHAQGESEKVF